MWYTSDVKEERPEDGVRIFRVTADDRYRVLVISVPAATVSDPVTQHVQGCTAEQWRPMHSFTSDTSKGDVAPDAYGCMLPRDRADLMLDGFNSEPRLARAMRLAFNVSAPCAHREGKTDPKLGGTWLRNHVLYHLHPMFRGTRAWTALLHEGTSPDAFHADGYEELRRAPGSLSLIHI